MKRTYKGIVVVFTLAMVFILLISVSKNKDSILGHIKGNMKVTNTLNLDTTSEEIDKVDNEENKDQNIIFIARDKNENIETIDMNGQIKKIEFSKETSHKYSSSTGKLYLFNRSSSFLDVLEPENNRLTIAKDVHYEYKLLEEQNGVIFFIQWDNVLFRYDGKTLPKEIEKDVVHFNTVDENTVLCMVADKSSNGLRLNLVKVGGEVTKIDDNIQLYSYPKLSSDKKYIIYLRNDGVYIKDLKNDIKKRLAEYKQNVLMEITELGSSIYTSEKKEGENYVLYYNEFGKEQIQISSDVTKFSMVNGEIYFLTGDKKLYLFSEAKKDTVKVEDNVKEVKLINNKLYALSIDNTLYEVKKGKFEIINKDVEVLSPTYSSKILVYKTKSNDLYVNEKKVGNKVLAFCDNENQAAFIDEDNQLYLYKNNKTIKIPVDISIYEEIYFGDEFLINTYIRENSKSSIKSKIDLDGYWTYFDDYIKFEDDNMIFQSLDSKKEGKFTIEKIDDKNFIVNHWMKGISEWNISVESEDVLSCEFKESTGNSHQITMKKVNEEEVEKLIKGFNKAEKIAHKYIKDDIKYDYILTVNNEKYFVFASPTYAKVGIIVGMDGKCYDYSTYNFRGILKEFEE